AQRLLKKKCLSSSSLKKFSLAKIFKKTPTCKSQVGVFFQKKFSEKKPFSSHWKRKKPGRKNMKQLIKYLCAFLFFTPLHTLLAEKIFIEAYQRENIVPLLPLLNSWGERAFSAYPYLLSSPKEQIVCPSDLIFVNSLNALVILAKKEDAILG